MTFRDDAEQAAHFETSFLLGRRPDARMQCHNHDHSDQFDFETYLPRIFGAGAWGLGKAFVLGSRALGLIAHQAISGHDEVMFEAKISEFKSKLSAYVARARSGETIVIVDRHTPVAKLVPIDTTHGIAIREPKNSTSSIAKLSPVRLKRGVDVVAVLREDRDAR